MTDDLGFNADACSMAVNKVVDTLRELCESTDRNDKGDGQSWFVLGFHTPDMDESGVYATSSLSTRHSVIACGAVGNVFATLFERELEQIAEYGFSDAHAAMLHSIASMRQFLDPDSLPMNVLLQYEAALMAHEGAEGPLSGIDRADIESGLDELLKLQETHAAAEADAENAGNDA